MALGRSRSARGRGALGGLQGDKGEGEAGGDPRESAYALFGKTGKRHDIYHFAL